MHDLTAATLAADAISLDRRLRALVAVADTVADLHAVGLVHGHLDEHQVELDPRGRPTLNGIEAARRTGDQAGDRSLVRPSLDVAALGQMLDRLTAITPDDHGRPTPTRRRRLHHHRRRPTRRPTPRRGDLRQLIDQATRADPAERPTARRFGAQLQYLCGPVSTRPTRWHAGRRGRPGRGFVVVGAGVAGLAMLGLGLPRLASVAAGRPADRTRPARATTDFTTGVAASPGGTVTVGGHRYAIGTPDDRVLVADWDCSGQLAAIVVRPSGAVFRFDGWAQPGDDLVGLPAGSWPASTSVAVGHDDAGCAVLASTGREPTVSLDPRAIVAAGPASDVSGPP